MTNPKPFIVHGTRASDGRAAKLHLRAANAAEAKSLAEAEGLRVRNIEDMSQPVAGPEIANRQSAKINEVPTLSSADFRLFERAMLRAILRAALWAMIIIPFYSVLLLGIIGYLYLYFFEHPVSVP